MNKGGRARKSIQKRVGRARSSLNNFPNHGEKFEGRAFGSKRGPNRSGLNRGGTFPYCTFIGSPGKVGRREIKKVKRGEEMEKKGVGGGPRHWCNLHLKPFRNEQRGDRISSMYI